jgi:hypothetical protein
VEVLRLYDPDRRPASWTEIVRPGQFVAFAKHVAGGASCDGDGRVFASTDLVTCLVFDDLAEARQFCDARVRQAGHVQFEIFDAEGRRNPPLLVVLHPSQAHRQETDPARLRRRTRMAIALAAGAVPLMVFDYVYGRGALLLPTLLAINMLLAAGRLAQLNMAVRTAERERQARLARYAGHS